MSSQFCSRVGNNIKKFRKEKEITLKQLANMVGLTEATVQKYESGNIKKIDIDMLKKLSDALGVSPENLTEWGTGEYQQYKTEKQGAEEAKIIKMYSQLTKGHRESVRCLIESLLEYQKKYNSSK